MAQSAKLQLRQTHGLSLTPQLMQSIKLLQMNAVELSSFIHNEVEKNPLLEISDRHDELPVERREQHVRNDHSTTQSETQPQELDGLTNDWEVKNVEARLGTTLENVFDNETRDVLSKSMADSANSQSLGGQSANLEYAGGTNDLDGFVADQQNLREFVAQQAAQTFRKREELEIAREIIDLIDTDGYLRGDLTHVQAQFSVNADVVKGILNVVQKFDPPGIGARNLAECMQIQLREKNRLDPAMEKLTQNLPLLARRNFEALKKICGVDHEDLVDMVAEIQKLEPRPGDAFEVTPIQNAIPDVFIKPANDGGWQIELNTQTLPRVLINREYYAEIKQLEMGKTDKQFMIDNLQNANWLVASLDQRAQTILKVATEIVKQQDLFFVKGEEFLRPLTLKIVAAEIGMHESTISRVTRNKFLACPSGIFEFKYFFMSGIAGQAGEPGFGRQSIRAKIGTLILAETKDSVLSDEKIAKNLHQQGIDIARRTVAKYRESLGILSSIERRREKKALGKQ